MGNIKYSSHSVTELFSIFDIGKKLQRASVISLTLIAPYIFLSFYVNYTMSELIMKYILGYEVYQEYVSLLQLAIITYGLGVICGAAIVFLGKAIYSLKWVLEEHGFATYGSLIFLCGLSLILSGLTGVYFSYILMINIISGNETIGLEVTRSLILPVDVSQKAFFIFGMVGFIMLGIKLWLIRDYAPRLRLRGISIITITGGLLILLFGIGFLLIFFALALLGKNIKRSG